MYKSLTYTVLFGTYACSSNSPLPQHNEGGADITSFFEQKKKQLASSDTESERQEGPPPAKKTRTDGERQKATNSKEEDQTMVTEEATSFSAEPSRERLGVGQHLNTH